MLIRSVVASLFLIGLGVWLGYHAVAALGSGVADVHHVRVARAKRPLMFWLAVTVQLGFSLLCFYGLYLQWRI